MAEADAIISQLQRAVEIKDDDIAALQDELAKTQAELEVAQTTTAAVEPEPEAAPESEAAPEPEPMPEPEPTTFMDVVAEFVPLDNPLILGAAGGGLLLLVILIVVFAKRRRKTDLDELDVPSEAIAVDEEAPTEISMVDDATQLPPMAEEDVGPEAFEGDDDTTQLPPAVADTEAPSTQDITDEEEDDPLEGLNIYLAYEDYENATKLVKDVIGKHPDRHEYKLRLLEIYYASKNVPTFETTARELQDVVG